MQSSNAVDGLEQLSLAALETRIKAIDKQLENLSPISLRGGIGAVGGRSALGPEQNRSEGFQVELSEPTTIDQIVLVPSIWRDTKTGLRADGFPLNFRVIVGCPSNPDGDVIANFTEASGLLPRIAPLVIPCSGVTGSWVRIEANKLSQRLWDSEFVFQLSEIMIFSGQENVA
ncbi:MAG: hypothetical protein AAF497_00810 [Planctomycetota bacterium]